MSIVLYAGRAYSTLYGLPGSKEVRSLMKKLRVGRERLRSEGHPTDEHLEVPVTKMDSMRTRYPTLSRPAFEEVQSSKRPDAPIVPQLIIEVSEDVSQSDTFSRRRGEAARLARRQRQSQRDAAYSVNTL